jgi:hypothetical protein
MRSTVQKILIQKNFGPQLLFEIHIRKIEEKKEHVSSKKTNKLKIL